MWLEVLNIFLQILHLNILNFSWTHSTWISLAVFRINCFWQMWQWYRLILSCLSIMWVLSWILSEYLLSHCSQTNFLMPRWTELMCLVRISIDLKFLLHLSQGWLSTLCTLLMWALRQAALLNTLSQMLQVLKQKQKLSIAFAFWEILRFSIHAFLYVKVDFQPKMNLRSR